MQNGKLRGDFITQYEYQQTTGSGHPQGEMRRMNWREVRIATSVACPGYPLRSLNHMRALLHAAGKGNTVDLTHFAPSVIDPKEKVLIWSARLKLVDASN